MTHIRSLKEHEAERVRDLYLEMCVEGGTPLSEANAQRMLVNLKLYATNPAVHCFVAEEQATIIGFVTCRVTRHPVEPGLVGEIEELYVQSGPRRQALMVDLVKQAVIFMQAQGVWRVHYRTCIGGAEAECPQEEETRTFWQSLGWENDMTIFSIYGNVPGDPIQCVWDEYQAQAPMGSGGQQP
jgi:hypothetical protein